MSVAPPILNVHTPTSSFAIIHSLNDESLQQLYNKLTRKGRTEFRGQRVTQGWIKYYWDKAIWNLDDESDYTIFVWRQKSPSTSASSNAAAMSTLHVHDPTGQLPEPAAYRNRAFYLFEPSRAASPLARSERSAKSHKGRGPKKSAGGGGDDLGVTRHRKAFEKFHSENGVRTVMGSIGPVQNVRMLLKKGYRHVYISRKFALKYGFIPADAAPGHYGYGGLVNLGKWPITLTAAGSFPSSSSPPPADHAPLSHTSEVHPRPSKSKTVSIPVYLSEEPHFDVVLGRSFFERRQIRTSAIDATEVVCLDTGEKIECELVVLKDGRGDVVIVT